MKYSKDNEKEVFYEELLSSPKENDVPEIVSIITEEREQSGFYELCQKFVDIALNAIRTLSEDKTELICCSRFDDINAVAIEVKLFISRYKLTKVSEILDMIKERFEKSVSFDEQRQKCGIVSSKGTPSDSVRGYAGKWYYFVEIPAWEQVKEDIIRKVSEWII